MAIETKSENRTTQKGVESPIALETSRPRFNPRMVYLSQLRTFTEALIFTRLTESLLARELQRDRVKKRADQLTSQAHVDLKNITAERDNLTQQVNQAKKPAQNGRVRLSRRIAGEMVKTARDDTVREYKQVRREAKATNLNQTELVVIAQERVHTIEAIRQRLIVEWALEDPLRVLGYARYTLRDDPKRKILFLRYAQTQKGDPLSTVNYLEKQYQKDFADTIKEPKQNGHEVVAQASEIETKRKRLNDSQDGHTKTTASESEKVEEKKKVVYPIGRVIVDQNARIQGYTVWAPEEIKSFVIKGLSPTQRRNMSAVNSFLAMISYIQEHPEDTKSHSLGGRTVRAIRGDGIPGVTLSNAQLGNFRVVYRIYNAKGDQIISLEGISTNHQEYDRIVRQRG